MPGPNVLVDLAVVDDVAIWGNMPSALSTATSPDANMRTKIQEAITGWSNYVNWYTGRQPGYFTGTSGKTTLFNEVRDGSGSTSMVVVNGPIDDSDPTRISIKINGQQIPQSTDWNVFGWYKEANPAFFGLRRGTGFLLGALGFNQYYNAFYSGKGNVFMTYPGGYAEVPPDLFEATLRAVTVLVSKSLREDESGRTTPQTGSVTQYRTFPWDKDILLMLANYKRTALTYGGGSY